MICYRISKYLRNLKLNFNVVIRSAVKDILTGVSESTSIGWAITICTVKIVKSILLGNKEQSSVSKNYMDRFNGKRLFYVNLNV